MASGKIASLFSLLVCFCMNTDMTTAKMNGAPDGACESMKPHHGVDGDDKLMPLYNLSMMYDTSTKKFMVHLGKVSQDTFKGFLIRIVESSSSTKYVEGKFEVPSDQSSMVKILACDNGPNAVTHVDNKEKESIRVMWTPGSKSAKDNVQIMAQATVVKVKTMFVEGIKSASVNIAGSGSPSSPPAAHSPAPDIMTSRTASGTTAAKHGRGASLVHFVFLACSLAAIFP